MSKYLITFFVHTHRIITTYSDNLQITIPGHIFDTCTCIYCGR